MSPRVKRNEKVSGSPPPGEPEYLLVGTLRRSHGVRGDMVLEIATDFPERLKAGTNVFVGPSHRPFMIRHARPHAAGLILGLDSVDSPEKAGRLRNQGVFVKTVERPKLPAGQYYQYELIGFEILGDHNEKIGTLEEIMRTGANDVYVVKRPDGGEVLLPVIPEVVLEIKVPERVIRVHLLPGLVDGS
jgi:16S rRNA processing protein RimM